MQFVFVTAISISTSETQGKLTQYQHHRKKNNRKIVHPVEQPLADLDLEKQHGKVIQHRGGARNKLLEKRDENTIIICCPLASYIETFYCSEYSDKNNTK